MHKCICNNKLIALIPKNKESKKYQASCHKCGRRGPWYERQKAIEQWDKDMKLLYKSIKSN